MKKTLSAMAITAMMLPVLAAALERPPRPDRPERPARDERPARPERPERPERPVDVRL